MTCAMESSSAELLTLAATHETDGHTILNPLIDFKKCSTFHPQRHKPVHVCKGREKWTSLVSNHQHIHSHVDETFKFSVMSWNMLSEAWYLTSSFPQYHGRTWNIDRFPIFMEWVSELSTSLIALQEVDIEIFERDLLPWFQSLGYDGLIQKIKQPQKQPCGVATFWKHDQFELADSKSFSRALGVRLRLIKPQKSSSSFEMYFINVHLESSQSSSGSDKRARQLNSTLEWASRARRPLVLSGDFNTGADSMLLHVLRSFPWHGHRLVPAYEHPAAQHTVVAQRATFAIPQHHFRIDHILYSHEYAQLVKLLDPLNDKENMTCFGVDPLSKEFGLPNNIIPSDHLPIAAEFRIDLTQWPLPNSEEEEKQEKEANTKGAEAISVPEITSERSIELTVFWFDLQQGAPDRVKSRPTQEELERLKAHKAKVRGWLDGLSSQEKIFVRQLKIPKKNVLSI